MKTRTEEISNKRNFAGKKTNTNMDKPYWTEYPIVILFDPLSIETINPLEVDVSLLLDQLYKKMIERNEINFRIGGLAVFSSSLILRLQTEIMLEQMELAKKKRTYDKEKTLPIPVIQPPFRSMPTTVSLSELIISFKESIDMAIEKVKAIKERKKLKRVKKIMQKVSLGEIEIPETVDIERIISNTYQKIVALCQEKGVITFFELLTDITNRLDIVRIFFAVLTLHVEGKIDLSQDEDYIIYITLVGDNNDGGEL